MAFTGNYMCSSFKEEVLEAVHNFTSHTFKIALYDNTATLNASTTAYTSTGELATSGGYPQTGKSLTVSATFPKLDGTTAIVDFDNVSWTSASFTARGALIYNSSASNKAVAVLDFGSDKTVTSSTFEVVFPTADAASAIVRIA